MFSRPYLNDFIALGKHTTDMARTQVQSWLSQEQPSPVAPQYLVPSTQATLHLPVRIGGYTDFYSSREHATNVGKLFRDPGKCAAAQLAIPARRLPRPGLLHCRQRYSRTADPTDNYFPQVPPNPPSAPSQRVDFELEMAFVIGKDLHSASPSRSTSPKTIFSDWCCLTTGRQGTFSDGSTSPSAPSSARVSPPGMSPWIVPLAALQPHCTRAPAQDPTPLPYLQATEPKNYDIELSASINDERISTSNTKHLYWTMAQQLAHHTSNGCNVRVGDVMASGTISGPTPDSYGSLLELTENGRTGDFLQDGDTVRLTAHAGQGATRIGFGSVTGTIIPALHSKIEPRINPDSTQI